MGRRRLGGGHLKAISGEVNSLPAGIQARVTRHVPATPPNVHGSQFTCLFIYVLEATVRDEGVERKTEREKRENSPLHTSVVPLLVSVRGQQDTPVVYGVVTINYPFYINCSRHKNTWRGVCTTWR